MNTAANLTNLSDLAKSKLALAHSALKKATQPKRTYSVEDHDTYDKTIFVTFYDQDNRFGETSIAKAELYIFIEENYRDKIDVYAFGEREQYSDTRNAYQYLEDNKIDVLTDYLNKVRRIGHV